MKNQLYFAYGSNLDPDVMAARCPDATPIGTAVLASHRVMIGERGVATLTEDAVATAWGVLWSISPSDEVALDRAEGVRMGLYRREFLTVVCDGEAVQALVYVEPLEAMGAPRDGYLDRLLRGADHFSLPERYVEQLKALEYSGRGQPDYSSFGLPSVSAHAVLGSRHRYDGEISPRHMAWLREGSRITWVLTDLRGTTPIMTRDVDPHECLLKPLLEMIATDLEGLDVDAGEDAQSLSDRLPGLSLVLTITQGSTLLRSVDRIKAVEGLDVELAEVTWQGSR